MTLTEARRLWADARADLAPVDVEGWAAELLQEDLEPLRSAESADPSIRLLPYFDSFLLGHRERAQLAGAQDRPRIYRAQGWIAPVVLVDGRAVATWRHERQGQRLMVEVARFRPLAPRTVKAIGDEARDLARFLGLSDAELRFA
jgi:hypothetical protein